MSVLDNIRNLNISDFDYPLPDERIAKHPLADRERCKLLYYHHGNIEERVFSDVPQLLPAGSMLVYNNTRVINARLRFAKTTGSIIEIFCLEPELPRDYEQIFQTTSSCEWTCLVGNSKRWKSGELTLEIPELQTQLHATRQEQKGNAWIIRFTWDGGSPFADVLSAIGEIPIPPYLNRASEASDATDYQTVYSHIDGSVAAPTAGLHFTDALLQQCDELGLRRRELTLHVGAGTFRPVKSETIGGHEMHHEFIAVPRALIEELAQEPDGVTAVGTTSVRTLESLYYIGQILEDDPQATDLTVTQWMPYSTPCRITTRQALENILRHLDATHSDTYYGSTQLLIAPGFQYRITRAMITNFHQPQSTLLLLVAAFVGKDRWRELYNFALARDFRFLSYGDAQLLIP